MKSQVIAECKFQISDQEAFAALSGDFNPLHLDARAARRTMFGRPIVHGVHILLWALEEWVQSQGGQVAQWSLQSLDVRFPKPAYLDEELRLTSQASGPEVRLTVRTGNATICVAKIAMEEGSRVPHTWVAAPRSRRSAPADLTLEKMASASGFVGLDQRPDELDENFPALVRWLGPEKVSAILATTRIVGMECPGLNSIFSAMLLTDAATTESAMQWDVVRANQRLSLVSVDVRGGGLQGRLTTLFRPVAQDGPNLASIVEKVAPGQYSGRSALVVGGSRGLGRTTASLLSAGGADVVLTYHQGRSEAENAAASMVNPVRIRRLDVTEPESAIAELSESGPLPTEVYYFATPQIFVRKKALFEPELFLKFVNYYVTGLMRLVMALREHTESPLSVFIPSTDALNQPLPDLFEYTVAKAAAESTASLLAQFDANVWVHTARLPRLPSDQTLTVLEVPAADPVDELANICSIMAASLKGKKTHD